MNRILYPCKKCDAFIVNTTLQISPKINKTENCKNIKTSTIENNTIAVNSTNGFTLSKTMNELNYVNNNIKDDELEIIDYPYEKNNLDYNQSESNSSSIIENEESEIELNAVGKKLNRFVNNKNFKHLDKNCPKKIHRLLKKNINKIDKDNSIKTPENAEAIKGNKIYLRPNKYNNKLRNINNTNKSKKNLQKPPQREFIVNNINTRFSNISLKYNKRNNKFNKYKSLDVSKETYCNTKNDNKTTNFSINTECNKNGKNDKINKINSILDTNKIKKKIYIRIFNKNGNPFDKIYESNKKDKKQFKSFIQSRISFNSLNSSK